MMARSGRDGFPRAAELPETRCFSIVFNNGRKTMNFLAPSEESATFWVRGLNYIKKKLETLLPRLKEELYPFIDLIAMTFEPPSSTSEFLIHQIKT